MTNFRYHKISKTKKIRYISKIYKSSLSIVFLHGFMSDLEGEKPKALLNFAKKNKINFSLETDLSPVEFLEFIKFLNHAVYKINYDMGNSASLGYNSFDEISKYGKYISVVHVKDRKYKGKSVILGTGDVKFNDIFKSLSRLGFNGPITLQSYRNKEGLQVFKKQFFWIKNKYLNKYNL